jgi:hypothetical protein
MKNLVELVDGPIARRGVARTVFLFFFVVVLFCSSICYHYRCKSDSLLDLRSKTLPVYKLKNYLQTAINNIQQIMCFGTGCKFTDVRMRTDA